METTTSRTDSDSAHREQTHCVSGKWASADDEDCSEQLEAEQLIASVFEFETPAYDPEQFTKWTPPGWGIGTVTGFWIEEDPSALLYEYRLVVQCQIEGETEVIQLPFHVDSTASQPWECKEFLETCRVGSDHAGDMIGREFYYKRDPMSASSPATLFAPTRELWCARLLQLVGVSMTIISLTALFASFAALVSLATVMGLLLFTVCTLIVSVVYAFGMNPTGVPISEHCFES